jgi:hypothetical protein
MTSIAARYQVANYDTWRKAFDERWVGDTRPGMTRVRVFQGAHDPQEVLVVLEGATARAIRAAWDSGEFRASRLAAGMQSEVLYLPAP